jgi:hypothetical protein
MKVMDLGTNSRVRGGAEVPNEETTVKPVRVLKKWHGDQHLAMRCCGQLKKWTQRDGGSWKKLAVPAEG